MSGKGVVPPLWLGPLLLAFAFGPVHGQELSNLFHITGGVSDTALQYCPFRISAGQETVLADLKASGKVTYFYFTDQSQGEV